MATVVYTSPNGAWKIKETSKGVLSIVGGKKGTIANGTYPVTVEATDIIIKGNEGGNLVPKYVINALQKFLHQFKCLGCKKTPWEIREYQGKKKSPRKFVEEHEGTLHMFKRDTFYCTSCYVKAGQPTGTPKRYAPLEDYGRAFREEVASARQGYSYEQEEVLPAFVYGTLRNGCGNYEWLLKGHTKAEMPAKLEGAIMFNLGGCPMIFPTEEGETGTIVGELMYINDEEYPQVLRGLDNLEGYRPDQRKDYNNYNRERVTVTLEDGSKVVAWVYWGSRDGRNYPKIESGDWMDANRYRQSYNSYHFGRRRDDRGW